MGNGEFGIRNGTKKGEDLKNRTKRFALRVIKFVQALPRDKASDIFGKQLLRAASSVGANYRAVCRAKSTADFLSKLSIVEEEADETHYWLELIDEAGLASGPHVTELMTEANEITAIVVASIKNVKEQHPKEIPQTAKSRLSASLS